MAAPAPQAAVAVARPTWKTARPMESDPHTSTKHLKPLSLSTASSVYGTASRDYWIRKEDGDRDKVENAILSQPPCPWT